MLHNLFNRMRRQDSRGAVSGNVSGQELQEI
jgi:hypothetical protein